MLSPKLARGFSGEGQAFVRARVENVVASERPGLLAWLGTAAAPAEAPVADIQAILDRAAGLEPRWADLAVVSEAVEVVRRGGGDRATLDFRGTDAPRLDPKKPIAPVADLDELSISGRNLIDRIPPAPTPLA